MASYYFYYFYSPIQTDLKVLSISVSLSFVRDSLWICNERHCARVEQMCSAYCHLTPSLTAVKGPPAHSVEKARAPGVERPNNAGTPGLTQYVPLCFPLTARGRATGIRFLCDRCDTWGTAEKAQDRGHPGLRRKALQTSPIYTGFGKVGQRQSMPNCSSISQYISLHPRKGWRYRPKTSRNEITLG